MTISLPGYYKQRNPMIFRTFPIWIPLFEKDVPKWKAIPTGNYYNVQCETTDLGTLRCKRCDRTWQYGQIHYNALKDAMMKAPELKVHYEKMYNWNFDYYIQW